MEDKEYSPVKDPRSPIDASYDVEHGQTREYRAAELQSRNAFLGRMKAGEIWLDNKLGIETRGIDRIPDEEKQPPSMLNVFLLWWSLNIHVGVIPLGVLGPEFGLTLRDSIAAAVVGTALGALCTASTGILGPKLGLRAIATSRYSFGYYGAKLCSVLNVVVGGGFAVVNYVVVGQILSAVSEYKMTITVGIVIIAVLSYLISIFGFKVIHSFEKYSWMYTLILFFVLIGQAAPKVNPSLPPAFPMSYIEYAGTFLTILAINFSNASGWCSISSDYYCNYPASTKSWKIWLFTYFGVVIPTSISVIIGSCLGNAYMNYAPWGDAYGAHGLGGLISTIYHPYGWSEFALVLLTFSVLGNNIAINYSSGLSIQLLGHYFHAVPRLLWSLLFVIVVAVIAIAGQSNLSAVVSDFVSMLGYWTVSFTVILMLEHFVFRRRDGYILSSWDQPNKLPWGVAAITALFAGYLAGGVTGMSQVWYIGPIARQFGGDGGDVGVYLSAVITLVWYSVARTIEKKYVGR